MKSLSRFEIKDDSLIGTLTRSDMGPHIMFRIPNADMPKFSARRYHAVLTPLE
jgi:hypothetical protein